MEHGANVNTTDNLGTTLLSVVRLQETKEFWKEMVDGNINTTFSVSERRLGSLRLLDRRYRGLSEKFV